MLIVLALLCALLEGVFTALEVALGALSRARLRALQTGAATITGSEADEKAAGQISAQVTRVVALLDRPDQVTLLFLTVTSLSLWAAASLLTWSALARGWPVWVLLLTLVALLFVAEVVPLLLAARHAETIALRGAGFVALAMRVLSPLLVVLGGIASGLARVAGAGRNATPQMQELELRNALLTAEEEGVIESDERALLEGAMDFRAKKVREVMTPRLHIAGVEAGATLAQALEISLETGHSRLPVYEGTLDTVVGVLATKDLLPFLHGAGVGAEGGASAEGKTVRDVVRKAYFVPEGKRVAATLEELRRGHTLMAIVVEENGGTAGLVTLEDLLEELVGEIQDEYDLEEAPLRVVEIDDAAAGPEARPGQSVNGPAARLIVADAASTVRDFGRFFGREFKMTASLFDTDGDRAASGRTLASLALDRFGDVPHLGDRVRIGEAIAATPDIRARFGLELEVTRMNRPRIEQVQIRLIADAEAASVS